MTAFTRRDFLKLSIATAGLVSVGSRFVRLPDTWAGGPPAPGSSQWIATCCNMCGGQTGVLVRVDDGKVAKIEPNPDNPIGVANTSVDFWRWKATDGAAMCPKGNSATMTLYDPDRVKAPLRRTNPQKGKDVDPGWVAISWDEAYGLIAGKLKALLDTGEAHKLVWFSEDHSFTHIQQDFCALFGTPNYHNHSNLCDVSRKASYKLVMGDERPLGDFANSRYILLFGWNPLSATKWSHLPRIITRAIENGAKFVIVDPNLSDTAARAHEWIPIRPATDGALALALAHLLVKWNLYDQEFVEQWTVGFKEFAEFVQDKTPEWAEQITTVPASTIRRMAREMGEMRPTVVDVWSGPGQHSNAVQGGRAIALLNVLLGSVDRSGGLMNPDRKGDAYQKAKGPKITAPRLDGRDTLYPFAHSSGVYTETFNVMLDGGKDRTDKELYMPKVGMVVFQNLAMSVPGSNTVEEALKKLEFLVVVDTHMSETALLADVVIPGTTYLERYDFTTNWVTWSSLGLRQPVVKPIFGQPAEYEFVIELGRRLGLKDADGKDFFRLSPHARLDPTSEQKNTDDLTAWYEDYLSLELEKGGPKISLADLKKLPGATWIDPKGTKYEKFKSEVKPPADAKSFAGYAIIKSADGKTLLGFRDDKGGTFKPDGSQLEAPADAQVDDKVQQVILGKGGILWGFLDAKGILKDKDGKGVGFLRDGKFLKGFNTPSRLLEFSSSQAAAKKDANGNPIDTLPAYAPRVLLPTEQYPLYFISWKEAPHTHTRTFNNPYLMELRGWNPLRINTKTAARLGIQNGDKVWVESSNGQHIKAIAQVTEGIHPEVVGWFRGYGHWALGHIARDKGTSDNELLEMKSDPISGMSLNKEGVVKVYKA